MIAVLKTSEVHADTGKVLDKAVHHPQYVERKGVLLVITKAESVPDTTDNRLLSPWEQRAQTLESFYDPAKAW